MGEYTIRQTSIYGKPTGCFQVEDADGQVIMTFRKRYRERTSAVRARAEAWVAAGAVGIPGAAPIRPIGRRNV